MCMILQWIAQEHTQHLTSRDIDWKILNAGDETRMKNLRGLYDQFEIDIGIHMTVNNVLLQIHVNSYTHTGQFRLKHCCI